jgi:hypothetical protein
MGHEHSDERRLLGRFAHWRDGKVFDQWDIFPDYPPNGSPSDQTKDQWREAVVQKIQDCEGAEAARLPITRRIERMTSAVKIAANAQRLRPLLG